MDAGSAPERIGQAHLPDQSPNFWRDAGPAGTPTGFPAPEGAKACPMPPDNGFRLYDREGLQDTRRDHKQTKIIRSKLLKTGRRGDVRRSGWRTFLLNHADGIASIDLFVVPTISFRSLYGLLVLGHGRRRILSLAVTVHPTAEWVAQQVTEACGWDVAPQYLIRDRDRAYGDAFTRRIRAMGIRDRPTAPRSPWQNGYAERLIGSIRRECLDHVIVFGERHLRHVLRSYAEYYNGARTHLSLTKDSPFTRPVQRVGSILPQSVLGGLHHHYVRI